MEKQKLSAAVFVIIEKVSGHEDKILLQQEKKRPEPRMWKLPGGSMETGGWPEITVYRETQEETGLLIKRLNSEDKIFEKILNGKTGQYRFIVFRAEYMRGNTIMGDEVEKIGFFSQKEIKIMIEKGQIVPTHIPALKKYLEAKSPAR